MVEYSRIKTVTFSCVIVNINIMGEKVTVFLAMALVIACPATPSTPAPGEAPALLVILAATQHDN